MYATKPPMATTTAAAAAAIRCRRPLRGIRGFGGLAGGVASLIGVERSRHEVLGLGVVAHYGRR